MDRCTPKKQKTRRPAGKKMHFTGTAVCRYHGGANNGHGRRQGRNRWRFGGVRGTKLNGQTNRQTGEVGITLLIPKLWANVLGIFSQAPAHRRPLDNGETSSPQCYITTYKTRHIYCCNPSMVFADNLVLVGFLVVCFRYKINPNPR